MTWSVHASLPRVALSSKDISTPRRPLRGTSAPRGVRRAFGGACTFMRRNEREKNEQPPQFHSTACACLGVMCTHALAAPGPLPARYAGGDDCSSGPLGPPQRQPRQARQIRLQCRKQADSGHFQIAAASAVWSVQPARSCLRCCSGLSAVAHVVPSCKIGILAARIKDTEMLLQKLLEKVCCGLLHAPSSVEPCQKLEQASKIASTAIACTVCSGRVGN